MSNNLVKNEKKINSILLKINQISEELIDLRESLQHPAFSQETLDDPIILLDEVEGQSLSPMLNNTLKLLKENSPISGMEMSVLADKPRSSESMRLNQLENLGYATSYTVGRTKYFQIKGT